MNTFLRPFFLSNIRHARALSLAVLVLSLAACATGRNPLAQWERSKNFSERQPQLIVIHYTTEESAEQSLRTLKTANSNGPVGAHYLLGRDGRLYQLVKDEKAAWHAGRGRWGTISNVNAASIGIEIDNDGKSPFPDAQIETLLVLLEDLTARLRIPKANIIGHEDMAPTRKVDPGPLFPWKRLHEAGFGAWPADDAGDPPPGFDGWLAMRAFGYDTSDRASALRAFRHRFRGIDRHDDVFEPEDLRILHALTRPPVAAPPPQANPETQVQAAPAHPKQE